VSLLLPVDDALAAVLARAEPLPVERATLSDAAGRVLAEPAVALVDLPPFPSSSMDGFAVRSADTPGTLDVVGKVAAGRPESRSLGAGQAFDISTGGVVPEGADAVVPIERVRVTGGEVEVTDPVASGANVRERGGDVRAGATVHQAGARLTPARIAALAACGISEVAVRRRPRVAIAVTGSELRPPGEELEVGQIYESNGVMLEAALAAAGAVVERLGVAEDSEEALAGVLERALAADVVVTSGGVSVGPHDLVRRVLARLGVEEVFWGVAMRPGKPLAFGTRGPTLVFGLPGNPVSSLVGGLLFVHPALLALQGDPHPAPAYRPGTLATEVRARPERDDFVRATVRWTDTGPILDPILGQESHMIVHTSVADALVRVPRGEKPLAAGSAVRFLWL